MPVNTNALRARHYASNLRVSWGTETFLSGMLDKTYAVGVGMRRDPAPEDFLPLYATGMPMAEFVEADAETIKLKLKAIGKGLVAYQRPAAGPTDLIDAMAEAIQSRTGYRINNPYKSILWRAGGTTLNLNEIFRDYIEPGSTVFVQLPCWPGILSKLYALGLNPVPLVGRFDDPAILKKQIEPWLDTAGAIYIHFPSNPDGIGLDQGIIDSFTEVRHWMRQRGARCTLISDEIYMLGVTDPRYAHTMLESPLKDDLVVLTGPTKVFDLAGRRDGVIISECPEIMEQLAFMAKDALSGNVEFNAPAAMACLLRNSHEYLNSAQEQMAEAERAWVQTLQDVPQGCLML